MTTQRKDLIRNIAGSVISSLIVLIFTLYASGIVTEKEDIKKEIQSKVDKAEFDEHKKQDDKRFEEVKNDYKESVKEIKENINWLRSEVVEALKQKQNK